MKKGIVAFMLGAVLLISGAGFSAAQEIEGDKFSFGKVVSVGADQITVKEYDFAKDADVEVVYSVSAETEYGNVTALKDLAAGDDIVVDYTEKDGQRLVTTLVKEEQGVEIPVGEVPAAVEAAATQVEQAAPAVEAAPVVEAAADAVPAEAQSAPVPAQ